MPTQLRTTLLGRPLDPLEQETRHSLALAAGLAWAGLYLALATVVTVLVVAFAHRRVIELFQTGGGGYRIASSLVGPHAGLVSGAALIVDEVLTVTVSVAGSADALFSMLPLAAQQHKLAAEVARVPGPAWLNLRGAKAPIRVLLPVFVGFVLTHTLLIVYGIGVKAHALPALLWVQGMFQGHFRNVIFVRARTVDAHACGFDAEIERLRSQATRTLDDFVAFWRSHGLPATSRLAFGLDLVDTSSRMCRDLAADYPNAVFFTSRLVFGRDNALTRMRHKQAALAIQRSLHVDGLDMLILPMKL